MKLKKAELSLKIELEDGHILTYTFGNDSEIYQQAVSQFIAELEEQIHES